MARRLTDTETLLWSLGQDPNLASTMGLVAILASRPDPERLRTTISQTVAAVERLQQRVSDPSLPLIGGSIGIGAPLGRLEWVTDHQFDLDHHFRVRRLGSGSKAPTEADLRLAAAQFINDPFDRTRPLWQFQLITGLSRGRAALLGKVHHSISDGIGILRLAENLLEFSDTAEPPEPVDLQSLFAPPAGSVSSPSLKSGAARVLEMAKAAASTIPTPSKLVEVGTEAISSAKALSPQLPKSDSGSELWSTRSRNRRLELLAVPFESLRARAEDHDASINDLFVAACAQAALHYHRANDVELKRISATVVVSTQQPAPHGELGAEGDNAFIPVAIELPGEPADALERLDVVRSEVRKRRAMLADRGDLLGSISSFSGLVPTSVAAAVALGQAARVDFATSNLPGPPIPTWLAGQPLERIYPVGPVAGTAFNVTLITYHTEALFGLHIDPAAVTDSALLRKSLSDGFADLGVARR